MLDVSLDRSNMLGWLGDYPNQLRALYPAGVRAGRRVVAPVTDVLILGTGGGSAAAAYVVGALGHSVLRVPLAVCQGYDLPARVREGGLLPGAGGTLVVAVSHSGQTEETLSAFGQLPAAAASRTVVVAGGGCLAEQARERDLPLVELPTGMQARAVFAGILAALWGVLDGAGLTTSTAGVEEAAALAASLAAGWRPQAAAERGPQPGDGGGRWGGATEPEELTPLALAGRLADRLVLVYGGAGATEGVARRWKNQLAENGKTLAHWYTVPEAHHDEVVGWDAPPAVREHLFACLLRDPVAESPRLQKRLDVTRRLLATRVLGPDRVTEVAARGRGALARAVSLCLFGDFLSVYVALLRGIDPTPVPIIVSLKEEMARG